MRLLPRSPWIDRASNYGTVVASATASLGASWTRVGYHTDQDAVGGLTRAEILGLLR